jgi:polyhydroxybutyrate depolymerase
MRLWQAALAVPVFVGVAVISGYLVRGRSDDNSGAIRVDGRERTYSFHVPAEYDGTETVPLLLALHGRLGTGSGQERLARLDKVSDEHRFLVVYPDGLDRSWADGRAGTPADRKQVDEVKFLSALIDDLENKYKIDHARVYATGMSNGGFMSGRLACELADKIAAVAIVGASLSEKEAGDCHPVQPVSVLIVQGTADPVVPFAGGPLGDAGVRGVALSHDAAVQRFVAADHCPEKAKTEHIPDMAGDGTNIEVTLYGPCADGSEVRGYVVNGGGHTWPGGMQYLPAMFIGKTTRNLDGSEVIWEFLSRHERG